MRNDKAARDSLYRDFYLVDLVVSDHFRASVYQGQGVGGCIKESLPLDFDFLIYFLRSFLA